MKNETFTITDKQVAEEFEVLTEQLSSLKLDELFNEKHVYTLSENNIRVLYFPELLHVQIASLVAGCCKLPNSAFTDVETFIVVDDIFMQMPEDVQKWVIYHELGHIHYKHIDDTAKVYRRMIVRTLLNKLGLTTKAEIEADLYATGLSTVGDTLRALNYIQANCGLINVRRECTVRKLFVRLFGGKK